MLLVLMLQWSHTFAHAMAAELSWHVQNCESIQLSFFMQQADKFLSNLAYKSFVKWLPSFEELIATHSHCHQLIALIPLPATLDNIHITPT